MELSVLKTMGCVRSFKKEQFICMEQEAGSCMYILLQGTVDMVLNTFDCDGKNKVIRLQSGSFFGEMSLLDDAPRSASIVASSEDVLVLEVEKDNFLKLIVTYPDFAYRLLCSLRDRIMEGMKDCKGRESSISHFEAIKHLQENDLLLILNRNPDSAQDLLKYLSRHLRKLNQKNIQIL